MVKEMEDRKWVLMKVSGDDNKIQMEWSFLVDNGEEWIRLNGEGMKKEEVSLIGSA